MNSKYQMALKLYGQLEIMRRVLFRRYHLPAKMKCFAINNYSDSFSESGVEFEMACPSEQDLKPDEALVKVRAASINPIDIEMSRGYGRNAINLFRKTANVSEFPLILGRDFSGIIVKRGKAFRRYPLNHPVYGVRWVVGQGTHAEFVIVNKHEISEKPQSIDFVEAASLPYVACTTWPALINTGAVPMTGKRRRILIPGGSGGIGSFAAQLCQAYDHDVVTTCSTDAVPLLYKLGLKNVIDYKSESYENDLRCAGPFDVILDTLDERYINFFQQLLKPTTSSQYVSLRPSLLGDTDKQGLVLGIAKSGGKLVRSTINQLSSGRGLYQWGFFSPNGLALRNIKSFIDDGKIQPLVDQVYDIEAAVDAYEYVKSGHARGKTVIEMSE